MTYRSQNWLINQTDGANLVLHASYVTGLTQHEVRLPGQLVARRSRESTPKRKDLASHFTRGVPISIYRVRESLLQQRRAAMTSFFAQDQ
jgi:hypothetical protein